MSRPIELILFGARGNTPEILETMRDINAANPAGPAYVCVGCLDDEKTEWGRVRHGVSVLGPVSSARDFPSARFVNGIGGPASFWRRAEIVANAGVTPDRFETLVHPTAAVASTAHVGRGAVLFPHVSVGSYATIGDHVLVLPSSVVSHDVRVGAHTCVAAGACLSSCVSIGTSVYLGTNCSIIGSVRIGDRALVGMGAVVLDDVDDEAVVVGNPAKVLRAAHMDAAPAAGRLQ